MPKKGAPAKPRKKAVLTVEGPTTIKVRVTKEDIANGQREHQTCCPVGLALRRTTGHVYEVWPHESDKWSVGLYNDGERPLLAISLDPAPCLALSLYDNGEDMVPFTFLIDPEKGKREQEEAEAEKARKKEAAKKKREEKKKLRKCQVGK